MLSLHDGQQIFNNVRNYRGDIVSIKVIKKDVVHITPEITQEINLVGYVLNILFLAIIYTVYLLFVYVYIHRNSYDLYLYMSFTCASRLHSVTNLSTKMEMSMVKHTIQPYKKN